MLIQKINNTEKYLINFNSRYKISHHLKTLNLVQMKSSLLMLPLEFYYC